VNLGGENLTDGDRSTVWVSQGLPIYAEVTKHKTGMTINEILLVQSTGREPLQWFEIFYHNHTGPNNPGDNDLRLYAFITETTNWERSGDSWTIPANNYCQRFRAGRNMSAAGSFAILCSNKQEFEKWYQLLGGYILEWPEKTIGMFNLNPFTGSIGLWNDGLEDVVSWGMGPAPTEFGERHGPNCDFDGHDSNWSGPRLTPAAAANTMAKTNPGLLTSPSNAAWTTSSNPTPGDWERQHEEWAVIDLGNLNCQLESELSSSETDEALISDSTGLEEEDASVMIDAEVISYESIDHSSSPKKLINLTRGEAGTTPATHPADTIVKPYEGGIAYNCPEISTVSWEREAALADGGEPIAPKIWVWYVSSEDTVIYPDDPDWDADFPDYWDLYCMFGYGRVDPNNPDAREHTWEFEPQRARHVMLVIHGMWDDGRARMNRIKALSFKTEAYDDDAEVNEQLMNGLSGAIIRYLLMTYLGYPESMITLTDGGAEIPNGLSLAKSRGLNVIRDLATRTGCGVYFRRDGTVEMVHDFFYPLRSLPDLMITWDREYLRDEIQLDVPEQNNVSQVVLRAKIQGADTNVEVRFPATPQPLGSELVVEDLVLQSVTEATRMAELTYLRESGPISATIKPAGPAEWVELGERHGVSWELDTEGTLLSGRNFICTSISHNITLGKEDSRKSTPKAFETTIGLEEMTF